MALVGEGGWPGGRSGCVEAGGCDCEAVGAGLLAQPANTLSALGFVLVGLAILAGIGGVRDRVTLHPARGTPMRATSGYPATFAAVAILLGFGSAALHASMTTWGGWLDLVAMHALMVLLLTYNLGRIYRWPFRRFLATMIGASAALAVIQWPLDNGLGKYIFGGLIVLTLATEAALAGRLGRWSAGTPVARDRRWLWAALLAYGAGTVIWSISRSDGLLCAPGSLLQGHALWHLVAAAVIGLVYLYLRSEVPTAAEPRSNRVGA